LCPAARTPREVLKVLEATLALDSAVCQRAALHGLGHWHYAAPDEVARIVGHWLQGAHLVEHLLADGRR
jgi:hypothetical protein